MQLQPNTETSARAELEALCTQIRKLLVAGNASCYQIGVHYNRAVDSQLAEKAGYKNAPAYFCENIRDLSRTTLVTYGAVARVFSEEACGQYGMSALNLLMVYAEASGSELDTNDPSTMLILVPDKDGVVEEQFFGECSVAELRKAIQRLRRPTSSAPLPADALTRAEQCRTVWAAYFPQKAGVRVEVRNRKGKAVLCLREIPLEQAEQLTALLGPGLRAAVRAA
jgi:hypothetical protein